MVDTICSGDLHAYVAKERLLLLTPRFPYPVLGGDRLRIYQIAQALRSRFSITLLSFYENKEEESYRPVDGVFDTIFRVKLPRWRSYLNTLCSLPTNTPLQLAYYRSEEFERLVRELLPQHDLALAHLIRTGQYLEHLNVRPRILEMTDAISMNYQRMREVPGRTSWKKFVYWVEEARLARYEHKTANRFDKVWITSSIDLDFLGIQSRQKVDVIPNTVDFDLFPFMPPTQGDAIVFIGNLRTVQNLDACLHFAKDILPLVRCKANIRFRIIGNLPAEARQKLESLDGVEVTGRVDKIADHIENAFCAVCPVRAGAGIQNKVLEYLALGLPSVVSSVGSEGLDIVHGQHVLQYSTPDQAAAQILELHRDKVLATRLAQQGIALLKDRYDTGTIQGRFIQSAEAALASA